MEKEFLICATCMKQMHEERAHLCNILLCIRDFIELHFFILTYSALFCFVCFFFFFNFDEIGIVNCLLKFRSCRIF